MTDKQLQLAKKLYALSKDKEAFEAQNASKMLNALLEKLGITLDELEGNAKSWRKFYPKNEHHKYILLQIVYNALNVDEIGYYHNTDKRKKDYVKIELTDAQYIEISAMYDFYIPIYEAELKDFVSSFIMSQKLYSNKESEDKDRKPLTPEERARLLKINNTAMGISKKNFRKGLNG